MFRSQDYMNQEQQTVAEDFLNMIETEYALFDTPRSKETGIL